MIYHHGVPAAHQPDPARISADRRCGGCGYNVRGLSVEGQCPECGAPIRHLDGIDDPLSQMPVSVVRVFRRGCWAATAVIVVVLPLTLLQQHLPWSATANLGVLLGLSILWFGAVWLATPALELPQAAWHGFSEGSRWRRAARLLQAGWAARAVLLLAVATFTKLPGGVVTGLLASARAAELAGVAGLVCFGVMLERLAVWVRDDAAEAAFKVFVWCFPVTYVIMLLRVPIPVVHIAAVGLSVLLALALPIGLMQLSRSIHYSVLHAADYEDRETRRLERRQKDAERAARAVARLDAASSSLSGSQPRGEAEP